MYSLGRLYRGTSIGRGPFLRLGFRLIITSDRDNFRWKSLLRNCSLARSLAGEIRMGANVFKCCIRDKFLLRRIFPILAFNALCFSKETHKRIPISRVPRNERTQSSETERSERENGSEIRKKKKNTR